MANLQERTGQIEEKTEVGKLRSNETREVKEKNKRLSERNWPYFYYAIKNSTCRFSLVICIHFNNNALSQRVD